MKLINILFTALTVILPLGCVSTGEGSGVELIEQMDEQEYNKWKLYISLSTKIAANQLVESGLVSQDDLDLAAAVVEATKESQIVPGATSLIEPKLQELGLTNDEVALLLLVLEQELLARGMLEWVDPLTGVVSLSPRTKELLGIIAESLRTASGVTEEETETGKTLNAEFSGKVLSD